MADRRRDFVQRLSSTVSPHHVTVALEDLRIRPMTATATGAGEQPGSPAGQQAA